MKLSSASLIFIALLSLAACNNQPQRKKGLIDPSEVHNPRTADGIPPEEAAKMATMDFADTTHNFGTINEGEKVTYDFNFTNNGKTPLTINGASGSCGCTVPDYPREPLAPGKTAVMKVVFNSAGKQGHQEKAVTISANTVRGTHMLYIQADVTPAKTNTP